MDGSKRGGPGLPSAGDRTTPREPSRLNRRGMRGSAKNIPTSRGYPVSPPVDEAQIQPAHPSRPKPRDVNRGASVNREAISSSREGEWLRSRSEHPEVMAPTATNSTGHLHHRASTAVGSLVISSMTEAKPVKEAPGVDEDRTSRAPVMGPETPMSRTMRLICVIPFGGTE
jgi:hypothetical protein